MQPAKGFPELHVREKLNVGWVAGGLQQGGPIRFATEVSFWRRAAKLAVAG